MPNSNTIKDERLRYQERKRQPLTNHCLELLTTNDTQIQSSTKNAVTNFHHLASCSTPLRQQMKCKHVYLTLIVLFVLMAILDSSSSTNQNSVIMARAEEMSKECLDKCGETCDIMRRGSRITCFSKCLANCLT